MIGDIDVVNVDDHQPQKDSFDYRILAVNLIGELPAENILDEDELDIFYSEREQSYDSSPIDASKLVVVLKATRLCNLRCTYCHSWADGPGQSIATETLIRTTKRILAIPNVKRFEFVWHGGEITMLRTKFFKKLIWLQQQFKQPGQIITNSTQTNAVNLTPEWLSFLKGLGMSVGISLDGIPKINDARRVDFRGRGTSKRVEAGIQKLRAHNIPYGALIVVDKTVRATDPREMLEYFKSIKLNSIEFLNIVPDNRAKPGELDYDDSYISYSEYIKFLSEVFDVWYGEYSDDIRINIFDDFIKKLRQPEFTLAACYWNGNCSQEVITLEPNGDVSPCDKYVGDPGSIYGSLLSNDLADLLSNSSHNQTAVAEEDAAMEKMSKCKWFKICNGGCPHDRVINRRHVPGYDDSCCGTGKLIGKISDSIGLR